MHRIDHTRRSNETGLRRSVGRPGRAILFGVSVAAGALSLQTAHASAPGPAKVKVALRAVTGASGAAVFVTTNTPTTVYYYTSSWTSDPTGPAAGTPCATGALATNAVTVQVVDVQGGYRRCR